jgi:HD-like signal output (HDOD) protein
VKCTWHTSAILQNRQRGRRPTANLTCDRNISVGLPISIGWAPSAPEQEAAMSKDGGAERNRSPDRIHGWLRTLAVLYVLAGTALVVTPHLAFSSSAVTTASTVNLPSGLWLGLLNGFLGLGFAYFRYTKRDRLSAGILLILVGLVSLCGLLVSSLWGLGIALMGLISSGLVALGAYITFSSRGSALDGPGPRRETAVKRPDVATDHTKEAAAAPTPTGSGSIDDPARRREEHRGLKDTGLLPSFQASVLKIVSAANRVRSFQADEAELADAVERDPAISTKVMQRATRADIGIPSLSKKNMTAPYAVQLLGPQVTLNIAIGTHLVEKHRDGSCIGFNYSAFWHECVARATAAREITYAKRRAFPPEVAYTAGLLCQIGRLSFATVFPKVYTEMIHETGNLPDALRELEFRRFRIDRNELAAEMMADWGLADDIWQAVLYQDQQDGELERNGVVHHPGASSARGRRACRRGGSAGREARRATGRVRDPDRRDHQETARGSGLFWARCGVTPSHLRVSRATGATAMSPT